MYYATHHFAGRVLNTFRGITANGYDGLWVALLISDPTSSGTAGVEIAYTGYQRQPIEFSAPAPLNDHLSVQNVSDLTWPQSSQAPGTATHLGIFDSPVGGNMVLRGRLTVPLEIAPQQQPSVMAGDIVYWGRGEFYSGFREAYLNLLRGVPIPGFVARAAMFNGNPEIGGTELGGENYSRPQVAFTAPFVAGNGKITITNEYIVSFPRPLASWGQWAYGAIMRDESSDIAVATNRAENPYNLAPPPTQPPKAIHRNYTVQLRPGDIEIDLD